MNILTLIGIGISIYFIFWLWIIWMNADSIFEYGKLQENKRWSTIKYGKKRK